MMAMEERPSSLLDDLNDDGSWLQYLSYRSSKPVYSLWKFEELEDLVGDRRFRPITEKLAAGTYEFSVPVKKLISRTRVGKKRTVYSFGRDEMAVLKVMAFLLRRYDALFSPNLYSFRQGLGVKDAIRYLNRGGAIAGQYALKMDIHNYFNSIPPERLTAGLRADLADDPRLVEVLARILADPRASFRGETVTEPKGAMAGTPVSPFLADFYLRELDWHYWNAGKRYVRYADDIIVFADTAEESAADEAFIRGFLAEKGLEVNEKKVFRYAPGEPADFLGFACRGKTVDIGSNTLRKIKGKIRRTARALRRWMLRKQAPADATLRVMARTYNRKFYGVPEDPEAFTWADWYFPTLDTDTTLKEIDAYLQEWMRYIVTGRHSKKNYEAVPYARLQACGYRPLVHAYWEWKRREAPLKEMAVNVEDGHRHR